MNQTERLIKVTAEFYKARDTMKVVYPDRYTERTTNIAAGINEAVSKTGQTVMQVAVTFLKQQKNNPMTMIWIMAAVADMIEPDDMNQP